MVRRISESILIVLLSLVALLLGLPETIYILAGVYCRRSYYVCSKDGGDNSSILVTLQLSD